MLFDSLAPYKHYAQEVICDSLNGEIKPETSDYSPSEQSVRRWSHWLMANKLNINGHLKSIGYRVLDFSEELLKSSISLLEHLRSSTYYDWLKIIITTIYNSGAFLSPYYD